MEVTAWSQLSPEPSPSFGERILVHDDPLFDGLIRGEVVVFSLKLAIEPAGQIAQRLGHDLLGILGGRLPGRTVARDVNGHRVFVVVAATVADLGGELVEVPPLDGLQPVGDAVERRVRERIVPDARGRALGVIEIALEAGPVALAAEPGSAAGRGEILR